MKATVMLSGVLALLLVATGCAAGPAALPGQNAGTPAQPASAGTSAPEAAAAIVNGHAIPMALYQAQFQAALASFTPEPGLDPKSPEVQAALRDQVLEMLIDQVLVDQAAERMGIRVDEAQVTAEVERIRSQAGGDLAGWLKANGYTEETFRSQVRSDLLGATVRDQVLKDAAGGVEDVRQRQEAFMRWLDGERGKATIERRVK